MPTETLPTRPPTRTREDVPRSFYTALALHAAVLGGVIAAAFISHRLHPHWGDQDPIAGSIQASMVNSLPLAPKQRFLDKAVLTSEKPSIAPTPPPPAPEVKAKATPTPVKTEPPPKPNEVLIPKKPEPVKPAKTAEREQPAPAPKRPAETPPPTPKATTGETAGVQIPQSITQLKNGTAAVTIEERAFGDRYAYYVRLISQKINQSKSEDPDPPDAKGKRVAVQFTIIRDGTPIDAEVITKSGSAALDSSTLRAIQRIDTFGPLPAGDHLTVTLLFTDK